MKLTNEKYTEAELDAAFPDVSPGHRPYGSRVIVQLRTAKTKSKGGIILTTEATETEKWSTQVGKVIAVGPVAFHSRTTLEAWPEGEWCKPGTFVRIPKYNQDRWEVEHKDGEVVLFMLINDLDLLAEVTCDPLNVKAYV